jgi:hypothetical protein
MLMSDGMPNWEEWSGLTEEQRQYSLYKVLADLYHRECKRDELCASRMDGCEARFKTLENRKWADKGVALVAGLISGLLGALGIKIGT